MMQYEETLEWSYVRASEAGLFNKSSCLAPALGVTKLIIVKYMLLITLFCATEVRLRCSTNPPQHALQFLTKG
jgi:hypothetical protein